MQGHQKQIYMFLMFIIFIIAFNFCRKAIKRDKDLKQLRDDALKQKIKADIIEQKLELERRTQEEEIRRQQEIISRLKEHKDICYDLYIFGVKPFKEHIRKPYRINRHLEKDQYDAIDDNFDNDNNKKQNNKKNTKSPPENHNASEPIIYLFVLVLIYFLMKSASDISQHFKQKTGQKDESRRCSLQDYAERKNSKAKFANHRSISVDTYKIAPIIPFQNIDKRRQSVSSGLSIEPGVPIRSMNDPGYRPLPLLRRGSVPVFSYHPGSLLLRQPSIDSFSEGESSPEVKRRVRMIQRH